MEPLYSYTKKAEIVAKCEAATYESETLTFLEKLFKWNHPERSTYFNEKVCIVLLRQIAKGEESDTHNVKQIFIPTYKAKQKDKGWTYTDNFEFIARFIKALSDMQEEGRYNIFMSFNTFRFNRKEKKYTRTQDQAFRSQVVGIDLDFYHVEAYQGLTYEQSIQKIKSDHKEVFKRYNPMIIQSGGGCQLYFLNCKPIVFFDTNDTESTQTSEHVRAFKELSKYFNDQFLDAGADAKCKGDLARIYKVPGVFSLKYGNPVKVALTAQGKPHSFRNIPIPPEPEKPAKRPQEPIRTAPEPKEWPPKKRTSFVPLNVTNDLFEYDKPYKDIIQKRIQDLDTVLNVTDNMTGFRESFLFIYSILLSSKCREIDYIQSVLCSKNKQFSEPLPIGEIENIIRQVLSKPYRISNKRIYEMLLKPLNIDLSLLRGNYTRKDRKEAHRAAGTKYREKKGLKKEFSKADKMAYIENHPSLSDKELSETLKCTIRTIRNLKKAA